MVIHFTHDCYTNDFLGLLSPENESLKYAKTVFRKRF